MDRLMWAGILAAPFAWGFQHVVGWGVSEAACDQTRTQWGVPFSTWVAVLCSTAVVVASAGLLSAILAFREVRDLAGQDSDPPPGRIWLMAIFGIVLSPIFLILIILTGAGALLLGHCHAG